LSRIVQIVTSVISQQYWHLRDPGASLHTSY